MAKKEKEVEATEAPADGAEGEDGEAPKKGKKKLLIIIAAVVLVVVLGGVAALVLGGGKSEEKTGGEHGEASSPEKAVANTPVYYELPEFLVNLSSNGSRVSFLKMSVTLELRDAAAVPLVEANKPRILDLFNTYLRELRAADVQGSAGIYRLRDELMTRLNGTIEEGIVKDILFSEIIVQ